IDRSTNQCEVRIVQIGLAFKRRRRWPGRKNNMENQTLNLITIVLLVIALVLKEFKLRQWRSRFTHALAANVLARHDMRTIIERMVHIKNLYYQHKNWDEIRELVHWGTEEMIELADKHINGGKNEEGNEREKARQGYKEGRSGTPEPAGHG
ncbi:MAG: hypothetical protein ACRCV5_02635, partial [Afipia sp.]